MGASRKSKGELTFEVEALARNLWKNKRQVGNLPIFLLFWNAFPGRCGFPVPLENRPDFSFEKRFSL